MAAAEPDVRVAAATHAANVQHSRMTTAEVLAKAQKARDGRWQKYLDRAAELGATDPEEQQRRAHHLLRADMARLSLIAVQAKAARRAGVAA